MQDSSLKLYNLFPRYYHNCYEWVEQFPHIKNMGFNTIYINSISYPGFSGSLYAPKDYYNFNPMFIDAEAKKSPAGQISDITHKAHEYGLKIVLDLVINHSSKDCFLTLEHPLWYVRDKNNNLVSPGVWENGVWISWIDLAQIDNSESSDRENLWKYWKNLIAFYLELGFDGFRADAAYQIPQELWKYLINDARSINPDVLFLAESLGCGIDESCQLAEAGFNFLFNSAKWWDFEEPWFLEQYNILSSNNTKTIAFPESHDTMRIACESDNNIDLIKRKIAFTGLISSGWMSISGTEYAWQNKIDVCLTSPADIESEVFNLESLIQNINQLRTQYPFFAIEGFLTILDHENDDHILIIKKSISEDLPLIYFAVNKTLGYQNLNPSSVWQDNSCSQIFSSHDLSSCSSSEILLHPGECKIFINGISE